MTARLIEISNKLSTLKKLDRNREVFGASSHMYKNAKVSLVELESFENANDIKLTQEFRDFLLHIGTGAGPDYGIYSLNQMKKEYNEWVFCIDENSKLSNQCQLTNADAFELIQSKQNDPNGFYHKRLKSANGILPIQTEGCTYYCYIILNGEQSGKIWAADSNEFQTLPAGLIAEFSFFDWYENWLDKSISKVNNNRIETNSISWWKRLFSKG